MFDIFYTGKKLDIFPHEQQVADFVEARKLCKTKNFWFVEQYGHESDLREFNWFWAPIAHEQHQTHVFQIYSQFGNVEIRYASKVPTTDEEVLNYHPFQFLKRKPFAKYWKVIKGPTHWVIDPEWAPNPYEGPYIYVFGNPWYSAEEMPTMEYWSPGATERKYVNEPILTVPLNSKNWATHYPNVDTATLHGWMPNPFETPYIYVFGNQWYPPEEMKTVTYTVPGATSEKFVHDFIAMLPEDKTNWEVPEEINAELIDFTWIPHPGDAPFVHHFGDEFQMSSGLTYTAPGATNPKFHTDAPLKDRKSVSVTQTVSMFFVDMNNKTSSKRFETLRLRYPTLQKIRYMNGWIETIKRCVTRSETQNFWVISSENVYDEFNFEWHAQPWQNHMTHVFASQWQKWSDTFLINKREFERHIKWAKTLEEFPNLNFVNDQPVYRPDDIYDIYYIDHFNPGSKENLDRIQRRYPDVKSARYVDNYLDTFKRILATAETDYIWITNSLCDYAKFDFTWQPEPWQANMLHVFPSQDQKFGDTFYMHIPTFKEQVDNLALLEWFDTVNYCTDQVVPRLPIDTVVYDSDSVVDAIKAHTFTGPYATFMHKSVTTMPSFTPSIWRKKDRVVHIFSGSGSALMVPREVKGILDTQVYDYPYLLPHRDMFVTDQLMDIIFISYDEPQADENFAKLSAKFPRARRLHGVEGMEKALAKAAEMSTTPWYYAVFAKTEIADDFNFDYMPDFMQAPKHYIFYAKNPVNGLEYGHMGVIMYNCAIVKNTTEFGIDYTMSALHEVVPVVSAISNFNATPYQSWRTAFRECAKLAQFCDEYENADNQARLDTWLTVGSGLNAEWCLQGARDGVDFYTANKGNVAALKQAFDWRWLAEKYAALHTS